MSFNRSYKRTGRQTISCTFNQAASRTYRQISGRSIMRTNRKSDSRPDGETSSQAISQTFNRSSIGVTIGPVTLSNLLLIKQRIPTFRFCQPSIIGGPPLQNACSVYRFKLQQCVDLQ